MSGNKLAKMLSSMTISKKVVGKGNFKIYPKSDPVSGTTICRKVASIKNLYNELMPHLYPWDKLKDTDIDNCGQHPPHHYLGCQRKEVDIC